MTSDVNKAITFNAKALGFKGKAKAKAKAKDKDKAKAKDKAKDKAKTKTKNFGFEAKASSTTGWCGIFKLQESPAVADKPARRLRKVCTVYVRAVGL